MTDVAAGIVGVLLLLCMSTTALGIWATDGTLLPGEGRVGTLTEGAGGCKAGLFAMLGKGCADGATLAGSGPETMAGFPGRVASVAASSPASSEGILILQLPVMLPSCMSNKGQSPIWPDGLRHWSTWATSVCEMVVGYNL
jgi:hypothetical protein